MTEDNRYYNVAVIHQGPNGERTLVGSIKRRRVKAIAVLRKPGNVPPDCYLKVWLCGDKESEAVYREQGWFPER